LVTLNDSAYTEAAQHFAYRIQENGGSDIKQQINKGYQLIFYKDISPQKSAALEKLYYQALDRFKKDKAKMMLMAGKKEGKQTPETAAMVVVAGAMMNTDEFVTRN